MGCRAINVKTFRLTYLRVHRQQNADKRVRGNKAQQVAKQRKGDQEPGPERESACLNKAQEEPKDPVGGSLFAEEHAWEATHR
jgi:hypothetical protein